MKHYEGLNLPQLLELLHPPVPPEQISMQPQTLGWALLLGWCLVTLLSGAAALWLQRRRNRYRRDAELALQQLLARATADPERLPVGLGDLLKRTALAAYPRQRVASLTGAEWAAFLRATSDDDPLIAAASERLAAAPYRRDSDAPALVEPVRRWIRLHRA